MDRVAGNDIDNLDEPKEGTEVFARGEHEPFEAPAQEFVPGPYYKNIEEVMPELAVGEATMSEGDMDLSVDRRDFMRLFSASALIASATACIRRPEEKAIPYVQQPIDQVPGVATHFATTCGECTAGCGVVVRTREGRPTKIEGSAEHPLSQGSTCAVGQGTLQGLYHPERRKKPVIKRGHDRVDNAEWEEVFEVLGARVKQAKNIGILTSGSTGNRHGFYRQFLTQMGSKAANLYTYDANSLISATAAAHEIAFGAPGMPRSDIRIAELIVGIGSEFLGVGLSPVYLNKSFSAAHRFAHGKKSKFVQLESGMTSTGAKADERHTIAPGSELGVTLALVRALLKQATSKGSTGERAEIQKIVDSNKSYIDTVLADSGVKEEVVTALAADILTKKSVIFCGGSGAFDENGTALQLAAIMANVLAGAYGSTLQFERGWMPTPVVPGDVERFFKDAGQLDMLFIVDANPAFTMPASSGIAEALKKIPNVISIQSLPNETDTFAQFVLPAHHYLESWGDEQPVDGFWSIRQPAVRPITDSRQAEDIFLWLAAATDKPLKYREYREYLLERWKVVFALVGTKVDFDTFFRAVLRRGFVGRLGARTVRGFGTVAAQMKPVTPASGLRLVAPLDIRLRDGRGANKPILQEVGDSMTTVAWDSWVALNPNTAKKLGFKPSDVLTVAGPGGTVEAALYVLPGLHADAVYMPRGNGHWHGVSRVTDGIGVDPLKAFGKAQDAVTGDFVTAGQAVKVTSTGRRYRMAMMQKHNDIANRKDIIKKVSFTDAVAGMGKAKDLDKAPDLYPALEKGQYRWGMSIDLDACSGCSACMVACGTENNIALSGREQIIRGREMHWLRIDRYFAGDPDNPEVTFQPVMCQHCNHAPCEAVCPVYATTHDIEGLNGQTYNRCVGTRYCANACPYKVRRFNWFTHRWNMVGNLERDRSLRPMNPDVTVRTRGIMEKCTMCVQRIRDGKHAASEQGGPVRDGDIKTACQQVCPANAISFGNLFDPASRVSQERADNRAYLLLGGDPEHGHYGIKTLPNVSYMMQVTFKDAVANKHDHDGGHDEHHG